MGKSDVKKLLMEVSEDCFSELVSWEHWPVVVDDSVIALRKFGHRMQAHSPRDEIFGIDALVHYIFDHCIPQMKGVKCYVALFDKCSYVTSAKQPEQDKRDNQAGVAKPANVAGITRSILEANRTRSIASIRFSAAQWGDAINTRESRQTVIRALCYHAADILPAMMQRAGVPEEHFLVLDFEGFASEQAFLPVVVHPSGVAPGRTEEFRNTLGEYDVAALHYVYHPTVKGIINDAAPGSFVLLRSVDTDMIPITLLNCDPELQDTPEMRVETTISREPVFFNPRVLRDYLCNTVGAEGVDGFVRMYILAGSDFAQSCPGMTNYKAMENYLHGNTHGCVLLPEEVIEASLKKGRIRVTGGKRASMMQERLAKYSLDRSKQRSHWCLNYWKHSVFQPEMLLPSPLGHGFSLKAGKLVYTEDLESPAEPSNPPHNLSTSSKRIKFF